MSEQINPTPATAADPAANPAEVLFIGPPDADHLILKDRDDPRGRDGDDRDNDGGGPAIAASAPPELRVGNTKDETRLKTRWDVHRWRENVRTWIALGLTGLFMGLAVLCLAIGWDIARNTPRDLDEVAVLIAAVLSPTIGLLGAILGFYFNERNKGSHEDA